MGVPPAGVGYVIGDDVGNGVGNSVCGPVGGLYIFYLPLSTPGPPPDPLSVPPKGPIPPDPTTS